ncbi:TPA: hypothetical protein I8522_002742 [Serratia marcescens]|nr:hypothetical protein [Serratia marcescens]
MRQQRRKGHFFQFFLSTGLKGRIQNSKYLHINQDIKEIIMSTFFAAVFAVIVTLIAIGKFIWAIVVAYRGLTWFWTNFDDLPHIWKRNWRFQRRFILRRIWKRVRAG